MGVKFDKQRNESGIAILYLSPKVKKCLKKCAANLCSAWLKVIKLISFVGFKPQKVKTSKTVKTSKFKV